ncbi:MAG: hypothetical protein IIY77_01140, partial [Lachnospiraceae bacterium]|nr:hypothetical protein [Lachnospiraceae bacterium]
MPMGTMQAGSQKEENELLLVFEDPSLPVEYLLSCKQENGLEYLSYAGARGKQGSPIMVKPLLPNRFWITFPADPEEHLYGTGETYSEWDLKGQEVRIFTAEHQNSKRIEEKKEREARTGKDPYHKLPFSEYESYYVQPTVVSSDKYFIHCDTT